MEVTGGSNCVEVGGRGEIGVRCCCGKTVGPLAVVVVHAWCVCMV